MDSVGTWSCTILDMSDHLPTILLASFAPPTASALAGCESKQSDPTLQEFKLRKHTCGCCGSSGWKKS